jgi:hypothetical protein
MPPSAQLVTLVATVGLIAAIITQIIKNTLIDPRMRDDNTRVWTLRAISYALNLGLLLAALAFMHQLDGSQFLTYLGLALGQFGVSQGAYSVLSGGANPKGGASGSSSDVGGDLVAHG